ncbi:MAG: DivIVA domain-containing protein [Mollicutes bacterium]|nr:DivIVA domain-containing protein [Mollicutes bacterium]
MKKFRTSFSGYNKKDVNDFVALVIKEYDEILQKLKYSTKEAEYLKNDLLKYKNLEKSLNDTLLVAQEATANAQRAAINEGKLIIEEAKRNASKILNNSLVKAGNIESEAEDLKRKVASYKRRFIALVESHVDDVNNFDDKL